MPGTGYNYVTFAELSTRLDRPIPEVESILQAFRVATQELNGVRMIASAHAEWLEGQVLAAVA